MIRGAILDSVRRRHYTENTRTSIDHAPEIVHANVVEITIDRTRKEDRLAAAVAELPALQRKVIALYYTDGLTDPEIAKKLKQRPRHVKLLRHNALRAIRAAVVDIGFPEAA